MKTSLAILITSLLLVLPVAGQYSKESSTVSAAGGVCTGDSLKVVFVIGQPLGTTMSSSSTQDAFSGFAGENPVAPEINTDADPLPDELDPDNDNDGEEDAVDTDQDGDAMLDTWELLYFATLGHASISSDADGDASSDGTEYITNTNPIDAESYFDARQESDFDIIYEPTFPTRNYVVRWTDDLTTGIWNDLANEQTTVSDPKRVTRDLDAPSVTTRRFYRVFVEIAE